MAIMTLPCPATAAAVGVAEVKSLMVASAFRIHIVIDVMSILVSKAVRVSMPRMMSIPARSLATYALTVIALLPRMMSASTRRWGSMSPPAAPAMDGMSCGSLETVLMLSGPALWTSCAVISVTSLPVSANAVVDAIM